MIEVESHHGIIHYLVQFTNKKNKNAAILPNRREKKISKASMKYLYVRRMVHWSLKMVNLNENVVRKQKKKRSHTTEKVGEIFGNMKCLKFPKYMRLLTQHIMS